MSNYAVIENNKVINTINSPSLEIAEEATGRICIEYAEETIVSIGYIWDGVSFTAPVIE